MEAGSSRFVKQAVPWALALLLAALILFGPPLEWLGAYLNSHGAAWTRAQWMPLCMSGTSDDMGCANIWAKVGMDIVLLRILTLVALIVVISAFVLVRRLKGGDLRRWLTGLGVLYLVGTLIVAGLTITQAANSTPRGDQIGDRTAERQALKAVAERLFLLTAGFGAVAAIGGVSLLARRRTAL